MEATTISFNASVRPSPRRADIADPFPPPPIRQLYPPLPRLPHPCSPPHVHVIRIPRGPKHVGILPDNLKVRLLRFHSRDPSPPSSSSTVSSPSPTPPFPCSFAVSIFTLSIKGSQVANVGVKGARVSREVGSVFLLLEDYSDPTGLKGPDRMDRAVRCHKRNYSWVGFKAIRLDRPGCDEAYVELRAGEEGAFLDLITTKGANEELEGRVKGISDKRRARAYINVQVEAEYHLLIPPHMQAMGWLMDCVWIESTQREDALVIPHHLTTEEQVNEDRRVQGQKRGEGKASAGEEEDDEADAEQKRGDADEEEGDGEDESGWSVVTSTSTPLTATTRSSMPFIPSSATTSPSALSLLSHTRMSSSSQHFSSPSPATTRHGTGGGGGSHPSERRHPQSHYPSNLHHLPYSHAPSHSYSHRRAQSPHQSHLLPISLVMDDGWLPPSSAPSPPLSPIGRPQPLPLHSSSPPSSHSHFGLYPFPSSPTWVEDGGKRVDTPAQPYRTMEGQMAESHVMSHHPVRGTVENKGSGHAGGPLSEDSMDDWTLSLLFPFPSSPTTSPTLTCSSSDGLDSVDSPAHHYCYEAEVSSLDLLHPCSPPRYPLHPLPTSLYSPCSSFTSQHSAESVESMSRKRSSVDCGIDGATMGSKRHLSAEARLQSRREGREK